MKCKTCGSEIVGSEPVAIHRGGKHHEACLQVSRRAEAQAAEELAEGRAWAQELGLPSPEEQERRAVEVGCPPAWCPPAVKR